MPEIIAPEYALKYIDLVKDKDARVVLDETRRAFLDFLQQIPAFLIDHAYAPGKWTIKEALQHIIDTERVFAFRALWFARKDSQPLPGFDETTWAMNTDVTGREWKGMIKEFDLTRSSNIMLFDSLSGHAWKAEGTANNQPTNVIALAYMCSGHVAHHMNIFKERYLTKG